MDKLYDFRSRTYCDFISKIISASRFYFIILNHAFQKKTQKTPKQAIKIAKARKQDYLKRRKGK